AGGDFTTAGDKAMNSIAKLDVSGWQALGDGVGQTYDDTSYVNTVAASGSDVYVGGSFDFVGGLPAANLAKWDGNSWSRLGDAGADGRVEALALSGANLYAAGYFRNIGAVAASRIAKWDGTTWSALGDGLEAGVQALAVSGGDLYVGGWFTNAGGVVANRIAKWNSSNGWSALRNGITTAGTPVVYALAATGNNLYAGGEFTAVDGMSGVTNIAKWNGANWSRLGTGLNGPVYALAASGTNL